VSLLALACIDLDTWLLPHVLTVPLLVAGVALSALGVTAAPSIGSSLLGAAVGWGAFAAVSFVGEKVFRKEALGFGDVWLLSAIGAWTGVAAILPVVLLASLQGTVIGLGLILLGRAQPGPQEPASGPPSPVPEAAAAPDSASAAPDGTSAVPVVAGTAENGASEHDPDADWIPPRNAVPFGPFLALGAVEWLWSAAWLSRVFPVLTLFR
jgi:leader peptidase (prepilin peptidase)/N-methyltransferase